MICQRCLYQGRDSGRDTRWVGGLGDWWIGGLVDWWIGGLVDWGIGGLGDWGIGGLGDWGAPKGRVPAVRRCRRLEINEESCRCACDSSSTRASRSFVCPN